MAGDRGLYCFNALQYVIFPLATLQMHLTVKELKCISIMFHLELEWMRMKDRMCLFERTVFTLIFNKVFMKAGNLTCLWTVVKSLPLLRVKFLCGYT